MKATDSRLFLVGLVTALAVVVSGPSAAKKIYSYTDENGITHFTDRPPNTDQEVSERQVRVDEAPMVTVRQDGPPEARRYYFNNRWQGPASVSIRFTESENVVADPPLPATFLLPEAGESHLLTVLQRDSRKGSRYALEFRNVPGDPSANPDARQRYALPFRRGQRFYVGQGFGGIVSHTDDQSYYAIDLGMPEGTPILAARDGVVMHAEEDFFGSGTDVERYATRANSVRVLHEDGTMAVYAHLALESVAVKPGRVVTTGELLGLSGNTGYSTGPHLHFVIQRNDGGTLKSIPFRFDDGSEDGLIPRAGTWLRR
ncbi:MAG: M23 family metallopeptidase [Pseudomonadota bacterium]